MVVAVAGGPDGCLRGDCLRTFTLPQVFASSPPEPPSGPVAAPAPAIPRGSLEDPPTDRGLRRPRPDSRRGGGFPLPPGAAYCLAVYLITQLATVAGTAVYLLSHPQQKIDQLAAKWDGWWYLTIARHGYTTSLRYPTPSVSDEHHAYSAWAFFPGYPLLVRGVHALGHPSFLVAAVIASAVMGFFAVWAVHALGSAFGGPDVGRTAALLFAAWPGAAVFLQPYSEALFLAATASCLLALVKQRWVTAGLVGAVAAATRPTGSALLAAVGVAALVHAVRHRRWRPLAAPVLAAAGPGAFAGYAWLRTGDVLAWRHAENLWMQHLDFSRDLVYTTLQALRAPGTFLGAPDGRVTLAALVPMWAGLAALVVVAVAAWRLRSRLDLPSVVYAAVTVFLILGSSAVAPRPRTMLALVPAAVWVAAAWNPRRVRLVAWCLAPTLGVMSWLWLWEVTP